MSQFEIDWYEAEFNFYYYWSYLIPISWLFLSFVVREKKHFIGLAIACFLLTMLTVVMSIDLKWELRRTAARSAREIQAVVEMDTANLIFAPFIGIGWGMVSTALAATPSFLVRRYSLCKRKKNRLTR